MAPEAPLQPGPYQQAQAKGHDGAAPELILSAHKKHPLHKPMQGVGNIEL